MSVTKDQTVRGYEYDVSRDGGTSLVGTWSTTQTVTPLTNLYCPGSPCSYRIRAIFDSTLSGSSGWKTAA
jgi:hypothetical protein